MNTHSVRTDLLDNLADKGYRDLFVAEQIFSGLPVKIRELREARFKNQREFAEKLGKHQSWVSQGLENPNYGKLTLSTLLEVASAFDVALEVDFVPFSRILDKVTHLSHEWFVVPSFEKDNFSEPDVAALGIVIVPGSGADKSVRATSQDVSSGPVITEATDRQVRHPQLTIETGQRVDFIEPAAA